MRTHTEGRRPVARIARNAGGGAPERPREDGDEAPETPPDEPKPAPIEDPPAEPKQPPYTVQGPARSGPGAPSASTLLVVLDGSPMP